MKILTLSNCPLIESQGSGYVIVNFVERLRQRGHTVEVWGPTQLTPLSFLTKARSHRLALGMAWKAWWRTLVSEFDVVEFYGGEAWLASWLLSRRQGRRFITVQHSNGLEAFATASVVEHVGTVSLDGSPPKWYQGIIPVPGDHAFRKVDGLVTVSEVELDYALTHDYQPEHRAIGIDNALPENFLGKPLQLQREKRVNFCGSWLAKKGSGVIVVDMTRILEEFPDWHFRLVGVGHGFRKEALFPKALWERIEVVPFVTDKTQLAGLYATSAISIAPSAYESFGLVVAEAMACGCAVVTPRTGFAAKLHDRNEVMLMQSPHSPSLYVCVRELMINDDLRRRVAQAGHARVQDLHWTTSIETLETTYLKWIRDFRAGRKVGQRPIEEGAPILR